MAEPRAPRLVLASQSPFRRRMLEAAGLSIEVLPADVDEPAIKARIGAAHTARGIAELLAAGKAEAVSKRLPDRLVIGADQVAELEGQMFDKPADVPAAREQLMALRGKVHCLYSAVALAVGGKRVWSTVERARLKMRAFSEAFLDSYLAEAGERLVATVGAYEIEGLGIQLMEEIEGDYFVIVGLPLIALLRELRCRGVIAT